ncbi:acetoin catabolism protein X, partial [Paracoccus sp. PXZ]
PELREPTITGLAVGLAVTGQVPEAVALRPNKWLEVTLGERHEIALVDVAVVEDRFVGARAIWKAAGFRDLFVTFGLPQAIGMSAIAGLCDPVDPATPEGRHVRLSPDAPRQ